MMVEEAVNVAVISRSPVTSNSPGSDVMVC